MALSNATFTDVGGAVQDLFASQAANTQAAGDAAEAANYRQAAAFARTNEIYAKATEVLQDYQVGRSTFQQLSTQQADIGGNGMADSGSAIYLAMDSARQGSIAHAVTVQQGQINIASYEEQAVSYDNMAAAADMAAEAAKKSSSGDIFGAAVKGIAAIASIALL